MRIGAVSKNQYNSKYNYSSQVNSLNVYNSPIKQEKIHFGQLRKYKLVEIIRDEIQEAVIGGEFSTIKLPRIILRGISRHSDLATMRLRLEKLEKVFRALDKAEAELAGQNVAKPAELSKIQPVKVNIVQPAVKNISSIEAVHLFGEEVQNMPNFPINITDPIDSFFYLNYKDTKFDEEGIKQLEKLVSTIKNLKYNRDSAAMSVLRWTSPEREVSRVPLEKRITLLEELCQLLDIKKSASQHICFAGCLAELKGYISGLYSDEIQKDAARVFELLSTLEKSVA